MDERTNERMNAADGQPKNTMALPTMSGSESIQMQLDGHDNFQPVYRFLYK